MEATEIYIALSILVYVGLIGVAYIFCAES